MGEPTVGGGRVELVDVVGDPEAELAVEELGALQRRRGPEGGFVELIDRRVDVMDHRLQPLRVPLGPVALPDPVRGPIAVGDEAAVGELTGAPLLGAAGGLRSPERPQVLVEVRPQAERVPLHDARGLVAALMLLEALLGAAGARADVEPGNPGITAATRGAIELDHVDAGGHGPSVAAQKPKNRKRFFLGFSGAGDSGSAGASSTTATAGSGSSG